MINANVLLHAVPMSLAWISQYYQTHRYKKNLGWKECCGERDRGHQRAWTTVKQWRVMQKEGTDEERDS